jgi:hypothetical protein
VGCCVDSSGCEPARESSDEASLPAMVLEPVRLRVMFCDALLGT